MKDEGGRMKKGKRGTIRTLSQPLPKTTHSSFHVFSVFTLHPSSFILSKCVMD
jgi:hypothetical protein